jgi:hypothetical protein
MLPPQALTVEPSITSRVPGTVEEASHPQVAQTQPRWRATRQSARRLACGVPSVKPAFE